MAFTRKALRARAAVRKAGATKTSYLGLLQQGEAAWRRGISLADNPYSVDTDEHEDWASGWIDASNND